MKVRTLRGLTQALPERLTSTVGHLSWRRLWVLAGRWVGRFALFPLRELVRLVVRRVPRDRQLLVFGAAGDRFGDNPAYLFLHMQSTTSAQCRVYWVTGSRRVLARLRAQHLPAVHRWSPRGVSVCTRAGWYVVGSYVTDVSRWFYDGAGVLTLWHGVGLKVIERQITSGPLAFIQKKRPRTSLVRIALKDDTVRPNYVLSTSDAVSAAVFAPGFGLPPARCLPLGYPRTDQFVNPAATPHASLLPAPATWDLVRNANRPLVAYLPTWRDDQYDYLAAAGVSLHDIADAVWDSGGRLLFKAHFNSDLAVSSQDRVLLVNPDDDINVCLPYCAALITDYSSVTTDYALLDRPILFYVPDYERYFATRASPMDRDLLMPGPRAHTLTELRSALVDALGAGSGAEAYRLQRQALREYVWNGYTGSAAASLTDFLATAQP